MYLLTIYSKSISFFYSNNKSYFDYPPNILIRGENPLRGNTFWSEDFNEVINFYKQNILEPKLFDYYGEDVCEKFSIIENIWNQYKDLK
jgi:hypothetical protein